MSLNEEFDELARRKLKERAFPFQEADWQDARKRIDAHRGGKGYAWFTGAVLLLIGGMVWYGTRSTATENTMASIEQVAPTSVATTAQGQIAPNEMVDPIVAPSKQNEQASPADTMAPSIKSIPVHVVDRAYEASTKASIPTKSSIPQKETVWKARSTKKDVRRTQIAVHPITGSTMAPQEEVEKEAVENPFPERKSAPLEKGSTSSNTVSSKLPGPPVASDEPQIAVPNATAGVDAQNAPQAPAPNGHAEDGSGTTVASNAFPDVKAKNEPTNSPVPNKSDARNTENETGFPLLNGAGPTQVQSTSSATGPTLLAQQENPKTSDQDSTSTVTETPSANADLEDTSAVPPVPLLIPERAPWEVSLLGGLFSSTGSYAGGNSAEWSGNVSAEKSVSLGAELMHLGRNFGIGAGVQYGSYAERIRTEAIDQTSLSMQNYWYLMAVDTTILFITDTIQPGGPYSGVSMDTTINVLTQGTDTTVNTLHVRDARDQVNRVSYLEVPLLLDAHLTQGRWMLGLRGGPTIGLLTGRRGSLPNPTHDGYVPLADQAFREVVFGYTARAYVRYRFNAGWSVGLEPAVRGQLFNSLGSGDLERKASAIGAMLSLTYRLR